MSGILSICSKKIGGRRGGEKTQRFILACEKSREKCILLTVTESECTDVLGSGLFYPRLICYQKKKIHK